MCFHYFRVFKGVGETGAYVYHGHTLNSFAQHGEGSTAYFHYHHVDSFQHGEWYLSVGFIRPIASDSNDVDTIFSGIYPLHSKTHTAQYYTTTRLADYKMTYSTTGTALRAIMANSRKPDTYMEVWGMGIRMVEIEHQVAGSLQVPTGPRYWKNVVDEMRLTNPMRIVPPTATLENFVMAQAGVTAYKIVDEDVVMYTDEPDYAAELGLGTMLDVPGSSYQSTTLIDHQGDITINKSFHLFDMMN